jgi:hypothetical protein
MIDKLDAALRQFDADAFAKRHGGYKESLNPRSREWLLTCPDPRCRSERLRWRHEPGVKMAWICWGCRKTGDSVDLVMRMERVDQIAAVKYILDGYVGGDAPTALQLSAKADTSRPQLMRLPVISLPQGFEWLTPNCTAPHAAAWDYLCRVRGIQPEDVVANKLGYCRTGRLARYVVFPCFMDGGLVYWQGRATWDPPSGLKDAPLKAWKKATGYRKTLNPYSDDHGTTASEILYGYDEASVSPHVVAVEGPIDRVQVGPHAVGLFGKVASPTKVERLLRMRAQRYTIYLDRGEEELARAMELGAQLSTYAPTFIAVPPVGFDPGKLTRAQNAAVVARAEPYRTQGLTSKLLVR